MTTAFLQRLLMSRDPDPALLSFLLRTRELSLSHRTIPKAGGAMQYISIALQGSRKESG